MSRQCVIVADPDAARTVLYKCTNHAQLANPIMSLMTGRWRTVDRIGLLMAKDDFWRSLRNAWTPAFAPASLRGYQSLMDKEALSLVAQLEARLAAAAVNADVAAAGSDSGGAVEVEMHSEMSRCTLAIVGSIAYGVDFNSPEYNGGPVDQRPQEQQSHEACKAAAPTGAGKAEPSLVEACMDWFRTISPSSRRTKWGVAMMLPCLLPLVRHIACALPDAPLAMHLRARRVISKTASRLIQDWRSRSASDIAANGNGACNDSATPTKSVAERPAGRGVAPGSFLGLMLSARDRSSGGRALTDTELEAQVYTFMLAGFETTANALTFAIYLLAAHPDKAAALVAELDEHLPPYGDHRGAVQDGLASETEPELTVETLDKLVYTEAVVNEALRLYPPGHSTSRLTDRPIKVLGYEIPAGTTIFVPIMHIQRKDSLWPDPEAFRPERFLSAAMGGAAGDGGVGGGRGENLAAKHPHAYLPFGGGTRLCIGRSFAMQEAKTVLARLFQRLRFELAPGQQVPVPLSVGLTLAPKNGVVLRLRRRGA